MHLYGLMHEWPCSVSADPPVHCTGWPSHYSKVTLLSFSWPSCALVRVDPLIFTSVPSIQNLLYWGTWSDPAQSKWPCCALVRVDPLILKSDPAQFQLTLLCTCTGWPSHIHKWPFTSKLVLTLKWLYGAKWPCSVPWHRHSCNVWHFCPWWTSILESIQTRTSSIILCPRKVFCYHPLQKSIAHLF